MFGSVHYIDPLGITNLYDVQLSYSYKFTETGIVCQVFKVMPNVYGNWYKQRLA